MIPGVRIPRSVVPAILWLVLVCLVAPAWGAQPGVLPAGDTLVVPTRAADVLASVDGGVDEWLRERVTAAGFQVVGRRTARDAVANLRARPEIGDAVLRGEQITELGVSAGATTLLFSEIRYDAGQIDLRLRIHATDDGGVVAGTRVEGRLADLGSLLEEALASLLTTLGVAPGPIVGAQEPRLSELGRYERAVAALGGGRLTAAWRELGSSDTPTAMALRHEIQQAAQKSDASLAERSRLASASGAPDKAWLHVRKAMREGRDPEMLMAGGDSALVRGEPEVAHRLYTQVVEIDPERREAHVARASTALEIGRVEEARESLQHAKRLDPRDPEIYEALGALEGDAPEVQVQHLMQAGDLRAERLESEEAVRNFRSAGEEDVMAGGAAGMMARATQSVAKVNERMGMYENALLAYEEGAALDPMDPDTLAGLGRNRSRMGDLEGAEEAFGSALEVDGEHGDAMLGMGGVMQQTGRPQEAVDLISQAKVARDKIAQQQQMLALAYESTGNPDAALLALTTGNAELPDHERAELLVEAARIQQDEGRLDEARITLEEASSIEPHDPPIYEGLAKVYEAQGDTAAAERARTQVSSLQGQSVAPTSGGAKTAAIGEEEVRGGDAKDFARLFASFPPRSPETRKPVAKVHYLGVATTGGWELLAREWFAPTQPDLQAIDSALLQGLIERFEVVPPPEALPEVALGAANRLFAFGTAREDISLVNDVLGVDASFVAQLERVGEKDNPLIERYVLKVRMVGGREADRVFIRANQLAMPAAPPFRVLNPRAAVPLTLFLILLSLPVIRGWGKVKVELDWENGPQTKGFFAIQISRKPGKVKKEKNKGKSKALQYQKKVRAWARFSKSMVGRETMFGWIPAGQRYVMVHGLLQDEQTRDVIGSFLEERKVKVARGKTTEIRFDFQRIDAPLEVRLAVAEGQAMPQVPIALRGNPDSIRYVREGSTVFHVTNGQHGVLVAEQDRVHDVDVLVTDHRAALVTITLGSEETAAFTDCPEAVDPYLQGDMMAASAALDRAGQVEVANLMRARFHEARGESDKAARFYEAAGHMTEAAQVAVSPELEDAGDAPGPEPPPAPAADGGALAEAEAFEASYDYESAIEAYKRAGMSSKVLELLEKTDCYFDAGTLAFQDDDVDRAVRNLQMVDLRDPDYLEACRLLAQIFTDREEWDLAVHKAEEAVQVAGEESAPLELHEQLGRLLAHAGRLDEAVTCFESIQKREPDYPGVADEIDTLRSRLGATGTRAAPGSFDPDPDIDDAELAGALTLDDGESEAEPERYELLGELGRGGMGVVYKARDTRLGRVVALKRLPENLRDHPTAVQLFLREARAAAALNHTNIVTLFDADQSGGHYYLTMEMLEGLPLDAILAKRGRLGARDALRLAVQISTGLQFAHEHGVIHRDIKTSNLFFTKDKVVKIMDFGLAKMTEEVRRAATVIGGTPYYMAPEQSEGTGVDHRADLYAFGVTLFELLTGRVPFTEGDVTYHHRHTPPPDPRELAKDIPDAVAELILRLMQKSPDDRFAETSEVTEALRRLAASA